MPFLISLVPVRRLHPIVLAAAVMVATALILLTLPAMYAP